MPCQWNYNHYTVYPMDIFNCNKKEHVLQHALLFFRFYYRLVTGNGDLICAVDSDDNTISCTA